MALESGSICRHVLVLFFTLFFIISIPFHLLLLPLLLFPRLVVRQCAKIFRKDLGKMVTVHGSVFASEVGHMFKTHTRCGLGITVVINGHISVEQLCQFFGDRVVHRRLAGSSLSSSEQDYVNPEMMQTLTKYWGYPFWKWDRKFRIENHIKKYKSPKQNETNHSPPFHCYDEDTTEIMNELISVPFQPDRSPWAMWVWNDVIFKGRRVDVADENDGTNEKSQTIFMFRCHHSLADGYSLLKLVLEDMMGQEFDYPVAPPGRLENRKVSICHKLFFMLKAPYEFVSMVVHSWDFNEWRLPEGKLTFKLTGATTSLMSVERIKEIKRIHGTSFNVVLNAAFAGGIRNFMLEQKLKIPQKIHAVLPLPIKSHPTKLRNHWTGIMAPLPIGIEDPIGRLRFIQSSFEKLQNSTVPLSLFKLVNLIGGLPMCLTKLMPFNVVCTVLMSNFPGPANQLHVLGHSVERVMFGGQLLSGNTGVGACSLSYNGKIWLGMGVDEAIISDPDLIRCLLGKVEEELQILRGTDIV